MATLLFPLLLVLVLYFLMIRPQRRKMQAQRELMDALQVGDEVLTSSGIYGTIEEFDEGTVFLRISDTSTIKITRASIAQRITYQQDWDSEAAEIEEASVAELEEFHEEDNKDDNYK